MNYEHEYVTYAPPGEDAPPLIMRTAPHDYLPIMTSIIEDGAVTVGLEIKAHGGYLQATGAAKRHPKDTPNAEIGLALAQARAFRAAAEELERITNDRIQKIDRDQQAERDLLAIQDKLNKALAEMESKTGWVSDELDDGDDIDWEDDSWEEMPASELLVHPVVYGRAAVGVQEWSDIWTVGELDVYSEEELTEFQGVGPATATRIREAIDKLKRSK